MLPNFNLADLNFGDPRRFGGNPRISDPIGPYPVSPIRVGGPSPITTPTPRPWGGNPPIADPIGPYPVRIGQGDQPIGPQPGGPGSPIANPMPSPVLGPFGPYPFRPSPIGEPIGGPIRGPFPFPVGARPAPPIFGGGGGFDRLLQLRQMMGY
jgi:hypothetical protein